MTSGIRKAFLYLILYSKTYLNYMRIGRGRVHETPKMSIDIIFEQSLRDQYHPAILTFIKNLQAALYINCKIENDVFMILLFRGCS